MNYNDAKAYCKSLDERAHLVEIYTLRMQKFVERLIDIQSNDYWWMGGSKQVNSLKMNFLESP